MMTRTLRIGIVEASTEIEEAIAAVVESVPAAAIVRRGSSLSRLDERQADGLDVLIADFRTCACGPGRAALHGLRRSHPGLKLIVTSLNEGREYERAAAQMRADGWVPTRQVARDLPRMLRQIARE